MENLTYVVGTAQALSTAMEKSDHMSKAKRSKG